MGSIAILTPTLASQIAAGEVVDRPASALKELLENALDAGATRCDVTIEGGGVQRLSVRDDGEGMTEEDVVKSVERHATSKLHRFEDLSEVLSFGFRGEALPSIASVSRLTVRSRTPAAEAGTEVCVVGGDVGRPVPIGMAPGTEVIVEDLFFNVPARRKFLRSSGTESGHLCDVAEAVALANPPVSITVLRDGRKAREWLRVSDRAQRVRSVLVDEDLARCYGERGPLTIEAYLSRPERARAGAAGLRLFCNGRPIRDRALLHSVVQAYGSVLERGRYPRGVVYVNLPPRLVDVNVHPQKSEVRFVDPRAVADALFDVISVELQSAFALPRAGAARWSSPGSARVGPAPTALRDTLPTSGPVPIARPADAVTLGKVTGERPVEQSPASATEPGRRVVLPALLSMIEHGSSPPHSGTNLKTRRVADSGVDVRWGGLRFLAQVRNLYLVCEGEEGLFVLDQHAAAERVQFHRLKQQILGTGLASQALLFPANMQLESRQIEALESFPEQVTRFGFEIRRRSDNHVSVHQVPKLLHRADPARLVTDLLDELARQGRGFSEGAELVLATMACHGAVRGGDSLAAEECQALLRALDGVDFSGHCPHGRPIVFFTPWSELERRVGRR